MNLVKIVIKNMRQRALATWLTGASVMLGVALAVAILLIKLGVQQRFEQGTLGYEMVVGAKGSPLQLVLNVVYNLDISPGNISWKLFEKLRDDKRVKLAVPFSVGDNYHGFRIVGTTDSFFKDFEFEPGRETRTGGRAYLQLFRGCVEGCVSGSRGAGARARSEGTRRRGQTGPGARARGTPVRSSGWFDSRGANEPCGRPEVYRGAWRPAVGRGQGAHRKPVDGGRHSPADAHGG